MRRFALGALCCAVLIAGCSDDPATTDPVGTIPTVHVRRVNVSLFSEQGLGVDAGTYWSNSVTIPADAKYASIAIDFEVIAGKDVEVYVLDDVAFGNWKADIAVQAFYSSGRVAAGRKTVTLSPGTYVVVVSNRFSVVTRKAVRVNATATYEVPL